LAASPRAILSNARRRALLDVRLLAVEARAKGGLLPDVSLDRGVLKIAPIEKSTPPEAAALAARLYAMLPRIRITDLLSEVARWTLFTDCFTHLRSGETGADPRLMAGLLADGLNLGLTRIAEACTIASLGQLAWVADWHARDETYALALQRLVDHQQREPLAALFGGGLASSSYGQFFRAGGFVAIPATSTPIMVTFPEANSTRTSPTATRRSTPR
jgi:Tn3 transposase DDE domain